MQGLPMGCFTMEQHPNSLLSCFDAGFVVHAVAPWIASLEPIPSSQLLLRSQLHVTSWSAVEVKAFARPSSEEPMQNRQS
jgi:hypothetical protein